MITGITRDKHVITDYTYVPLVFAAPTLAGFEEEKTAATICRVLSVTVLGYSLLTDAEWGVVKLIPYKTHAAIDFATGLLSFAAPCLLKKTSGKAVRKRATYTLLFMGVVGVVVGTLSLIGARKS